MTAPLALSNQRVQRLRRLISQRDARRTEEVLVVEGRLLLREASDAGWEIESQFVAPEGEPISDEGEVFRLASGVIEKVASTETPQPVIGVVRARKFDESCLQRASFVVVADGVADPGNLGTMLRSAAASGADAFAVTRGTVDHTSPKVVRASAGSLFRLPVVEIPGLESLLGTGLVSIGTTSHDGRPYNEVDLTRRIAVILGSEAHGLEPDSPVSEWATIPLEGDVESLNVAMACAVLCFEVSRQRRSASSTLGGP